MTPDFNENIERDGTAAVATESWREFLLGDVPDDELPPPDADLLSMWVADMDIAAPQVAVDAMRERLDRRILGYTRAADEAYRTAFAEWCARRYDWAFDDDHLVIGRGVVPALIDLIDCICDDPGDKVVTLTPAYHWFEEATHQHGLELVTCPLVVVDERTTVDLGALEPLLADPDARLFLLCHPHNPNGRDWTVEELTAMADLCRAHGVQIISDEIHADLLRSGRHHTPLAALAPPEDEVVTCLAPSKTFNLAGLLFSNIVVPGDELRAKFDERNSGITNPLSLAAATAVYREGDAWLDALRLHLDHNLRLVGETVASRLPAARYEIPDATYLAWIDLGAHADGIDDLSAFFAREAHVLVEGPHKFVADADRCIRLNVACPTQKVVDALDRMIGALERHAAGSVAAATADPLG
ncbi:MAG: aminotransferase class I/II-fold pyridoxal phosphate-dependent enzyme [Actinomycetota bacterium]